ncbi:TPA: type II toxin-antitoxin system RelE/ParE family toxin [Candidatus Woesearchaeota archaeon]|nr:type II toxin-antitoxin system RelE/ParE family toxin [Candidatus Woesearchaeota archaeon]
MYSIVFSDTASKQLGKFDKQIQDRILKSLERIRIRPHPFVTKLVGEPYYKFRVGDYRILLDINEGKLIILVVEVGHRKNIYH